MKAFQRLALSTALAAALGGVVGVVSLVVSDGTRRTSEPVNTTVREMDDVSDYLGDDEPAEHVVTPQRTLSLTQRIDSDDVEERHELALELLRRGPSALAQARALRPQGRPGRELQSRIVDALQKMRALRRGGDYARLERHLRLRLDLDAFATVVPDDRLLTERLEYWRLALAAVRARAANKHANDGEVALAEIEFARAQRDLGQIDNAAYRAVKAERLSAVMELIALLRGRRGVPRARVEALEEQVTRLGP